MLALALGGCLEAVSLVAAHFVTSRQDLVPKWAVKKFQDCNAKCRWRGRCSGDSKQGGERRQRRAEGAAGDGWRRTKARIDEEAENEDTLKTAVACCDFTESVVSFCEGTFPKKVNQFAKKKRQCVVGKSSAQELFFSGNEEKPKKQFEPKKQFDRS